MIRVLAALGLLAIASPALPADGACPNVANDIKYLVLWGPVPGGRDNPLQGIGAFAAKLGTTGDGRTRQLGAGALIPVWWSDERKIVQSIREAFYIARRTKVAVHFNVDDHIAWEQRPDLWNWYDPGKPGYNPENRKNVEWYDWEGTPNKRRYFTPVGAPSPAPHMCYNSPAVQKEIARIVSKVVGPALQEELGKLRRENKEYLFAGITVGQELSFDDYSSVPKSPQIPRNASNANPLEAQARATLLQAGTAMNEDHAPRGRLGYCALTNAGYSKAKPPADIHKALVGIIRKFIEFWDQQFVEAGIPCSRIYTHVPAPLPQNETNDAPIDVAFNPFARPGWTTYPIDTLANGLQPLYEQLVKHDNPNWGGIEANAALSNPNAPSKVSWEAYLAWHYNHGAKLVAINNGAADELLTSFLSDGAFGDEAMTAYRKFLNGKDLIER